MLLQKFLNPLVYDAFHGWLRFGAAEAGFCLPFKLRLRQFYGNNRDQPFPSVFANKIFVFFLQILFRAGIIIKRAGESGFKAGRVHSAIRVIDIVREAQFFYFRVVNIHTRHFHLYFFVLLMDVEDFVLEPFSVFGKVFYEREQAAFEIKSITLRNLPSAIYEIYPHASGQKCLLTNMLDDSVVVKIDCFENFRIGRKSRLGAGDFRRADFFYFRRRFPPFIFLYVQAAVSLNLDAEPFGERVYHRYADAMEPAGHFV